MYITGPYAWEAGFWPIFPRFQGFIAHLRGSGVPSRAIGATKAMSLEELPFSVARRPTGLYIPTMAILPVAHMGADVLKRRAEEIADFSDPALPVLVNDMIDTMFEQVGVGLAAPQVFAPKRVVVFYVPKSRNGGDEIPLTVMVNPIITPMTDAQDEQYEGCLSVPGLTGKVPRWLKICYSWQDLKGNSFEREAENFHARVVQHECDHLDGVLYPMRMKDMSSLAFVETLQAERDKAGQPKAEVVD